MTDTIHTPFGRMPSAPRSRASRRANLRCLALSASIAFAGCTSRAEKPKAPEWRECVDTLTHDTFRFDVSGAQVSGGIFSTAVVITDTDGFKRVIRDESHLKCRAVQS